MATTFTLTGKAADLVGEDFAASDLTGYVESSQDVINEADVNTQRYGRKPLSFAGDGTWTVELVGTGDLVQAYRVTIRVRDRILGVRMVESGWFALTADSDFADVLEVEVVAVQTASEFATAAAGYANAAEASADAAADSAATATAISGLTGEDDAVAALVEDATSDTRLALDVLIGSGGGSATLVPQPVLPEDFGAEGDLQIAADRATIAGGSLSTVTVTGATFVNGDVGKVIWIRGAAGSGNHLVTTIASRVSATQVTLAAPASGGVSNVYAAWGTDDTDAIQDAIDLAFTESRPVQLDNKGYMVNGALRTDRGGRSVLALPYNDTPTSDVVGQNVLSIRGTSRMDGAHPDLPVGSVIFCPRDAAWSSSFGTPSVIGGPTLQNINGGVAAGADLSKLTLDVRNLEIVVPPNPALAAINGEAITRMFIDGVHCTIASKQNAYPQPTHTWAVGIRFPTVSNYHLNSIGTSVVDGFYVAYVTNTEHFTGDHVVAHRCWLAFGFDEHGGWHGSSIQTLGAEFCTHVLSSWAPQTGLIVTSVPAMIDIDLLDIEDATNPLISGQSWWQPVDHVYDPANHIVGAVNYIHGGSGIKVGPLYTNGGKGLRLFDIPAEHHPVLIDSGPLKTHARLVGGASTPAIQTGGKFSNCINFPGVGSGTTDCTRAILGRNIALLDSIVAAQRMTFETWVKRNAVGSGYEIILSAEGDTFWGSFLSLQIQPSGLLAMLLGGTYVTAGSGALSDTTTWHHVEASWDGTTIRLFVDGALVGSGGLGSISMPDPGGAPMWIGAKNDYTYPLNAKLDEIRISSVARHTSAFTAPVTRAALDEDTVALWRCDYATFSD